MKSGSFLLRFLSSAMVFAAVSALAAERPSVDDLFDSAFLPGCEPQSGGAVAAVLVEKYGLSPAEIRERWFAHEAGHAMGLEDIYSWHPDTSLKVTGSVRRDWAPFDWCGNPDRGFYPDADTLSQSNLVERLVMCGLRGGPRRDFSWGNIHGIRRTWITTTSFEMTNAVSVGVFPSTIPPYPNHH